MNLYIMRHGIAVDREEGKFKKDELRPLTLKGKRKVLKIAKGLMTFGVSFDLILSSPYARARKTAEIVADVYEGRNALVFTSALAVTGNPVELVAEIQKNYKSKKNILLVGHEPYLSGFISVLVSGSANLSITMKKGGVCALQVDSLRYGRCAALNWLLAPRHFLS